MQKDSTERKNRKRKFYNQISPIFSSSDYKTSTLGVWYSVKKTYARFPRLTLRFSKYELRTHSIEHNQRILFVEKISL